MNTLKTTLSICIIFLITAAFQGTGAQTDPCIQTGAGFDINNWVKCRVDKLVAAEIGQRGTNKQVQSPSISSASTSLIDQTEAPDLVGLAFNLAGLGKDSDDESESVTSFTTSVYAVRAAMKKTDPLDPIFYRENAKLRNFSFTFGREAANEGNNNQSSTIVGFKVLLLNHRDISRKKNVALLKQHLDLAANLTVDYANTMFEIKQFLFSKLGASAGYSNQNAFVNDKLDSANYAATLALLTNEQKKELDGILKKRIMSEVNLAENTFEVYETIRRKQQVAFTTFSKMRSGDGADEHRTGLLYDVGVTNRLNLALNATFDYKDAKMIGGDTRGGRFAAEGYYRLNSEKGLFFSGKDPMLISFTGEGNWHSGKGPIYQAQTKLTIPLFDGVTLPLSVTWANQKNLVNESTVRGNFGITFDLAKALKGFRK